MRIFLFISEFVFFGLIVYWHMTDWLFNTWNSFELIMKLKFSVTFSFSNWILSPACRQFLNSVVASEFCRRIYINIILVRWIDKILIKFYSFAPLWYFNKNFLKTFRKLLIGILLWKIIYLELKTQSSFQHQSR